MNAQAMLIGRPSAGKVEELGAGHGAKSGYAQDIMPERLDAEERMGMATPIAGTKGAQRGRVPASARKTGHYEAVNATEAEARKSARLQGRMARIDDGLDQPGRPKDGLLPLITDQDDARMEVNDDPAVVPGQLPLPPLSSVQTPAPAVDIATTSLANTLLKLVDQLTSKPATQVPAGDDRAPRHNDKFFEIKHTVSFGNELGVYTVPAIDVRDTETAVVVMLPYSVNNTMFIPNTGSHLTVTYGDTMFKCMYPGTGCVYKDIGVFILMLLKDNRGE